MLKNLIISLLFINILFAKVNTIDEVEVQRMIDNGTASGMRNEGDDGNEVIDLFSQLLAQAKDDGLQDRLDDLRDKGKV